MYGPANNSGSGSSRPGFLGYYAFPSSLPLEYNGIAVMAGDYATVGSTDTIWLWDTGDEEWKNSGQSIDLTSVVLRNGSNPPTANMDWNGFKITNLGTPTNSNDATNKIYVDTTVESSPWKKTVTEIVSNFPTGGTSGQRIALTNGSIGLYTTSWATVTPAALGNTVYSIADLESFSWNGTKWMKISSSDPTSGVLLADGSVPLTNNWTVNTGEHTYKITNLGSGSDLTDATNIRNVQQIRINMVIEPVDLIETALVQVGNLSDKSVGYRYISISNLQVYEKVDSTTWLTAVPDEGCLVFNKYADRYYYYSGTAWDPLENVIDISSLDLSGISIPHSQITGSNNADYHPMYLKVDGKITMSSSGLNMTSGGTSYRIINLRDGVAANDAVNLKQLSTVAAGITYIDSCAGRYNTPPTGTDVPRLLIGPSPSGIFASYTNYIATYTLPSGPWVYTAPVKGNCTYMTDNGEVVEGEYLSLKGQQWIYNGEAWVLYTGVSLHDNLVDAALSTIHTRYLRNDYPGEANGLITFTPDGHTVPFAVAEGFTSTVTRLSADKVDGYDASIVSSSNSAIVRDADEVGYSKHFKSTDLIFATSLDDTYTASFGVTTSPIPDSVVTRFNANLTGSTRVNYVNRFNFINFNDVYIGDNKVITSGDSTWNNYWSKAAFPLSTSGWAQNYVLAYDGSQWFATNPNEISGTPHHALTQLDADDHTQYLTTGRHDTTSRHTLGSVVPHDEISKLTDVEISGPQTYQALLFNGTKWANSFVPAASYDHDSLSNVTTSTKHRYFPLLDGSRIFLDSITICNGSTYIDPKTGTESVLGDEECFNKSINVGKYGGQIKFTDYPVYDRYKLVGNYNGFNLVNGSTSVIIGPTASDLTASNYKFTVDTNIGSLLKLIHGRDSNGNRQFGLTTAEIDGWKIYHEGSERVSGTYPTSDPSVGGAVKGLNAQYIQGKTLDEIAVGGAEKHSILRELVYFEGTSTETDDHTQYFNGTRHNTTSAHPLGTVIPHDNLDGLTDVSISNVGTNDILKYNGTNWVNGTVSSIFYHDQLSDAPDSTVHTKYIRNDIDQTLTKGAITFAYGKSINPGVGDWRTVPFILNSDVAWSGSIPKLNADLVDGYHGSDLVKLGHDNTFTASNTFASVSDFQNVTKVPDTSMLPWVSDTGIPAEREIFINKDNGILMYRYGGNTYWLATKSGVIEGTTESCFKIDMASSNGGIRLCNVGGTSVRVSDQYGNIADLRAKDVYSGTNQIVIFDSGSSVSKLSNLTIDNNDSIKSLIRRGVSSSLSSVIPATSEFVYAYDTKKLVIGDGSTTFNSLTNLNTFATGGYAPLPSQTGNSGKFVTTDGTTASWTAISASTLLPSQAGNSGKYLTTDGSSLSWATVSGGSGTSGAFGIVGDATIAAGSTSVVVTHNYGTTPDWIDVVPDAIVSNVNSTTFTISTLYAVANDTAYRWRIMGMISQNGILSGGDFS